MKELIDHFVHYDHWANMRFVVRLSREADVVLDRIAPGSFPSLRATLLHIRDAEHTWWGRLTGQPTNWPATSEDHIDTVMVHAERLRDAVLAMDAGALHGECMYSDLKGNMHRQPAWQMIMHCLNHSTQHRGQIITQMRALGLGDIPANDLVVYQREQERVG
jgi:uncharacterized damage-inducible protein DinB